MQPEPTDFGLLDIARALRRRWLIVVAVTVLLAGAALTFSLLATKQYSASATLLFENALSDQALLGTDGTSFETPLTQERSAATNTALASLDVIGDRTLKAIGSRDDVRTPLDVRIEQSPDNNLATVTATDPSPESAALVATTFAEQFIQFRRETSRQVVDRAITLLQRRITNLRENQAPSREILPLESRLQDLQNLASVQTGNVQLVEAADQPDSPSSPRTARNVALAGFFGLILGGLIALLVDRLDRRVREPSELESIMGAPNLGVIPLSKALRKASTGPPPPEVSEPFRMLRMMLRFLDAESRASCILLTSSEPGEGKSTVAWHLALSAAAGGERAILIEADLRRPTLHSRTDGELRGRGLSTVLSGFATLDDALDKGVADESGSLDVLYAGPKPPNPAELLASESMRRLVEELRTSYDLVVIDSAPLPAVADAIPLLGQVDGVLVVSRLAQARRDRLSALRQQLSRLDARVLGVVINGASQSESYSGYGYYVNDPAVVA